MATLLASHRRFLSLIITMISIVLAFLCLTTTMAEVIAARSHRQYAVKLIHWNSVLSPYYTTDANMSKPATRAVRSSMARLAYLEAKATGTFFAPNDVRGRFVAEEGATQLMVNLSIGQPPVQQLTTMDTGSGLLWIQCLPCTKCFEQSNPLFDPSKSSTYANLSCTSPYCTYLPPGDRCNPANYCKFSNSYLDGITVKGLFGTETLTFETSDEGEAKISNMVIGCGHDNDGYNDQPSGIMGLGPENVSLATKMGSKFSFCIGSLKDPHYAHNQLILGDDAVTEGDSTPLEVFNNLYFLTLEGISVGGKMLNIDPAVFWRTPSGTGGVVIDSGTTIILLTWNAFDPLSKEVQRLLNGSFERVENPYSPSGLCYKGNMSSDLTGFPMVGLHFAGGAILGLDVESFFHDNGPGEGGVLVDTGSVLTWLKTDGYVPLQNEVQSLLDKRGLRRVKYGHNLAMLCYAGTAEREVSDFPVVALHFDGGVKLNMTAKSFFFQRKPGFFCMAVAESQPSLNGCL
ncbi:aspartic proteinase CDR1-like isoform X2 [Syzygium oleosum]|uniref:aspartic proteinase CDR1-like isoform X2 n=1 Tax=Syzygium oleosum TaxID=219896 RepID=UPI0024BA2948|nr:aspartic proteinase CDR1-like isoform X2 [Syzygium oleosum]